MCLMFILRLSSLVGLNVLVSMSHYEAIVYMLFSCFLYFQQLFKSERFKRNCHELDSSVNLYHFANFILLILVQTTL